MTQRKEPAISTFAALNKRHLEALDKFGATARVIELLSIISIQWIEGTALPAANFRRDHRRDTELFRWLADRRFVVSDGKSPYVPEFSAFCIILVARKRVAGALFREMTLIVNRALVLLHEDPTRTQVHFDEFTSAFPASAHTLPALKLLGTASLGIHLSANGTQLIQFSEDTLKGKKLLGYVSGYLDMMTRSTNGSFTSLQPVRQDFSTFSTDKLLLVDDAHKHAGRALSQWNSAPDTAISSAKSTLEATLKFIAHAEGLPTSGAITIPQLLTACKPFCGLGSEPSHKMSRSIGSLCTEIAEARNLLGDSHGKSPESPAPTRAEARFIVGVALQLSDCLLERYEAHRMMSPSSPAKR
ncbi:MAG: abortive infection family protein [Polaromonas sp.]|uniref:abortive infection family protein n=1 Tax=Polaromonas sp. TaxID=1869339 RepID=UPI00248A62F1|nr:abortive infection family protein [Polaromonas sp.]MDI1267872.1 abortive infection family protein [Polaromonas sp.]